MVDSYIKKREEIEKSNSPVKEEELKEIKNEVVREVRVRLETALPLFTPAIEIAYN
jgi:hypothetical protein